MIKNALIIVPHQDDELNIAGFILECLARNNIKINILYVTKGNFYKERYLSRQNERDKVLSLFGNITYKQLDYDDNYKADGHIFNDAVKREHIKKDIKKYIKKCLCDLIICIDFDKHADHRMVSALFDPIMCELIAEQDYRPIVLKKFAYLGVWDGVDDYFKKRVEPTKPLILDGYSSQYSSCLPNDWSDRVRIRSQEKDYALTFWKSKVYKAYCLYFTQCGFRHFFRAANSDIVYWYRNTNNACLIADITASSGDVKYINDFSIGNIDSIKNNFDVENEYRFDVSAWIPRDDDEDKSFKVQWDKPITISTLKVFQNFNASGHIYKFKIELSNGYQKEYECSNKDVDCFLLSKQKDVFWLRFSIVESFGSAGIRELEIYNDPGGFPWERVPFLQYVERGQNRKFVGLYRSIARVVWIKMRLINKIRKKLGLSNWG